MMTKSVLVAGAAALTMLLVFVMAAVGQEGPGKPQVEGQAGTGGQFVAPAAAGRPWAEGEANGVSAGQMGEAPATMSLLYVFSGVTDDGLQSAAGRKEATSILCTNLAASNTTIEVHVFNWDGSEVGTGNVTAAPNNSYTFSTQNTTIYFEDVILGSGGGTPAIFQGFGQVWTDQTNVICTAEVLDPLGYPPVFVSALELFRR